MAAEGMEIRISIRKGQREMVGVRQAVSTADRIVKTKTGEARKYLAKARGL